MKRSVSLLLIGMFVALGVEAGFWFSGVRGDDGVYRNATATTAPQPYMRFRIYGGSVIADPVMPPTLSNGMGDYAAIFAKHNICSLLNSGQIDEVWIWAGNGNGVDKPHLLEWTTSGPGWAGNTPDCGRIITTLTYNYTREADVALESFHHRLEGLLMHNAPCDFSTATWPWEGQRVWPVQCAGLLSDRFGFVARPFSGNDSIGGCGDAHAPPNILDNQAYNYSSPTSVRSMCPDWSQDGSGQVSTLSCQEWGCTHWGYHVWWMQNLPGLNNTNRDRYGQLHDNWWTYLFHPSGVSPTPIASPTATSTITPGPSPTPSVSPTPTAAPVTLFHDDFVDGISSLWSREGGAWSAVQDEYRQTDVEAYDTFTWVNGTACRDATVQVRMKLMPVAAQGDFAYAAGPVLQMRNTTDLYLADLTIVANQARIYKRIAGSWSQLTAKPFPVLQDRWYDLEFSIQDDLLSFYIDGNLELQTHDTSSVAGSAGLRADRAFVAFDDFKLLCRDPIPSTLTPTPSLTPAPSPTPKPVGTPRTVTYLPLLLSGILQQDKPSVWGAESHLATVSESPADRDLFSAYTLSLTSLSEKQARKAQTPVTEPVVYVIYYPGYGTPRTDVTDLTNELISLLEKATIYHGYLYDSPLRAVFLGQDGASYAGRDCTVGNVPDNIHIRVTGMHTDVYPVTYRVEDPAGGGAWVNPCTANWSLHVASSAPGAADLYFKPFRDAPDGTIYTIAIHYSDGSIQTSAVAGTRVKP